MNTNFWIQVVGMSIYPKYSFKITDNKYVNGNHVKEKNPSYNAIIGVIYV